MEYFSADRLLRGQSGLTIKLYHPEIRCSEPTMTQTVVSINGTDGNVYTGVATRFTKSEKKLREGESLVKLNFRFGDNQPTEGLDNVLISEGFVAESKTVKVRK